jgi:hypothetical protein
LIRAIDKPQVPEAISMLLNHGVTVKQRHIQESAGDVKRMLIQKFTIDQ